MIKRLNVALGIGSLLFLIVSCTSTKSVDNALSKKEEKGGWKLLFDGKTTNGWHTYLQDTVGSKWEVNDGAITFVPAPGRVGGGDIVTNEEFENFDFRLEWKVVKGSNSGIIFDIQEDRKYNATYFTGPEMQVLDNIDGQDKNPETHLAGCLYDIAGSAAVSKPKPVGEWNQVRILQNKGHLTLWLNGIQTYDGQMGSEEWNALVVKSKFGRPGRNGLPNPDFANFGKLAKGRIALQEHPGSSSWRNIKIRKL
jgi:hypothetical protein